LNIPARQDKIAIDFLAERIKQYKSAIERYRGVTLNDTAERAEFINQRNRGIAVLYEQLGEVSYFDYISAIHAMFQLPLGKQSVPSLSMSIKNSVQSKAVYLVGSFLADTKIAVAIENAGMKIVGDNLTESKRLFSAAEIKAGGDIYRNIAESILHNKLSPTQNNFSDILRSDLAEIQRKNVKGVIFATQRYCEPYDYLFACYKKILDDNEIPALRVVLPDSADSKKLEFILETFGDII
jgi:benzoyl-CoA reductase/2-hydroxyglutaryl-CoA dehydratase subunit BcrC/BadD/HgdB